MKRIIIIASVFIFLGSFTNPEELRWYSWNEGYELAKAENKPMLVFVQASWCHVCKRLNDKTFNNEEVIPLITDGYIPVKLDIEDGGKYMFKNESLSMDELLGQVSKKPVMGIPTTLFYVPDGRKVVPFVGLKDPAEMKEILAENNKK